MPINRTKITKINSTTFVLNYQINKKNPNKKSFVTPRVQTLFTDPISTHLIINAIWALSRTGANLEKNVLSAGILI